MCAGELQRSGPILAHSVRQFTIGGTTSQKFCNAVFGLCKVCARLACNWLSC